MSSFARMATPSAPVLHAPRRPNADIDSRARSCRGQGALPVKTPRVWTARARGGSQQAEEVLSHDVGPRPAPGDRQRRAWPAPGRREATSCTPADQSCVSTTSSIILLTEQGRLASARGAHKKATTSSCAKPASATRIDSDVRCRGPGSGQQLGARRQSKRHLHQQPSPARAACNLA